jgi:predicted RNA-binding protein with RPS1 domain
MVAEQEQAGSAGGEEALPATTSAVEATVEATSAAQEVPAAAHEALDGDGSVGEQLAKAEAAPEPEPGTPDEPAGEVAPTPEAAGDSSGEPQGKPEPVRELAPTNISKAEDAPNIIPQAKQVATGDGNRVVRVLSVGQQVTGTVKRVADFGAFVDIGVGRDGLIHISELSVRRVGKVTDVLAEGQEITAWIKKLDRDRNRISLTLIDPNTKTIRDLEKGQVVQGTVTRILPYGAFVDIGVGRDALLHVREMGEGYVAKPDDVVKVGETVEARIIELSRRRGRVDLSLKGLRPAPEPVPSPAEPVRPAQAKAAEREPEPEDVPEENVAEVEVLSPMELAFKKAMEAEGIELKIDSKKSGKRKRRDHSRTIQDEIIARTLMSNRK